MGGMSSREETPFYRNLRRVSRLLAWYLRFQVEDAALIPRDGPCILAANHASYLDPIVLGMACPRPVRFIMDRGYYEMRVVHWISMRAGAIPVENDPGDIGSLRRSLAVLKQAGILGIFPEGGRSDDGTLKPAKPGVALLALRTGVPVIPAAILGTFAALPRGRCLPRRGPVLVRFGTPVTFPAAWAAGRNKAHLDEATAMIMRAIHETSSQPPR